MVDGLLLYIYIYTFWDWYLGAIFDIVKLNTSPNLHYMNGLTIPMGPTKPSIIYNSNVQGALSVLYLCSYDFLVRWDTHLLSFFFNRMIIWNAWQLDFDSCLLEIVNLHQRWLIFFIIVVLMLNYILIYSLGRQGVRWSMHFTQVSYFL